jgi:hypothetical protein
MGIRLFVEIILGKTIKYNSQLFLYCSCQRAAVCMLLRYRFRIIRHYISEVSHNCFCHNSENPALLTGQRRVLNCETELPHQHLVSTYVHSGSLHLLSESSSSEAQCLSGYCPAGSANALGFVRCAFCLQHHFQSKSENGSVTYLL